MFVPHNCFSALRLAKSRTLPGLALETLFLNQTDKTLSGPGFNVIRVVHVEVDSMDFGVLFTSAVYVVNIHNKPMSSGTIITSSSK